MKNPKLFENWERSHCLQEKMVLTMRQVPARRTGTLHLRNMFNIFNGAEAQDQESHRDLVSVREEQNMDRPKINLITSKRD